MAQQAGSPDEASGDAPWILRRGFSARIQTGHVTRELMGSLMRTTVLAKIGRTMDGAWGKRAESARPWPTMSNVSWLVGVYLLM